MSRILITGGAGFIGSVLTRDLLSKGHQVTVIDNLLFNQKSVLDIIPVRAFRFIHGDVRSPVLEEEVKKHDIIIPLAALVGMPLCNKFPRDTVEVNSEQIRRITEVSSTNQFIIYPTTNSGYGIGQKIDGKSIECTEETPLNPISLYGKTKTEAEKYVLDKGNGVSFRLATVFGLSARMRLDLLVNDFTVRALRDKYIVLFEAHFKRNFIHIRDVCKAFEWSMTFPSMFRSKTFNVGLSSSNLSKLELCEKIKLQIPDFYITTSEFNKDPDQRDYIVSNKKLEDTGWYPNYKLEDGIAEIIAAYPLLTNNNGMYNFV